MITIRLFFDAGAGVCFWSENDQAHELFGDYPVANSQLPIPEELTEALDELCKRYDTSINWSSPQDSSPWSQEEALSFNLQVDTVLIKLRDALGHNYQVIDNRENITRG